MIKHVIMVGAGGAAGSILRFLVSVIASRYFPGHLPLATFIVNITGCFLIGLLVAQLSATTADQSLRFLLITGFCGGYTTFSAFSYENVMLINNGNALLAAGYIFASVILGIAAVWLGLKLY